MPVKTLYVCDRCQEASSSDNGFAEITISYRFLSSYSPQDRARVLWCEKCWRETEMISPPSEATRAAQNLPPPPTVEDLLRQVVTMVLPESDR